MISSKQSSPISPIIYNLYIYTELDPETKLYTPLTVKFRSESDFKIISDEETCSGITYDLIFTAIEEKYNHKLGNTYYLDAYSIYNAVELNTEINPIIDLDLSNIKCDNHNK
jgi:hypothetical protein